MNICIPSSLKHRASCRPYFNSEFLSIEVLEDELSPAAAAQTKLSSTCYNKYNNISSNFQNALAKWHYNLPIGIILSAINKSHQFLNINGVFRGIEVRSQRIVWRVKMFRMLYFLVRTQLSSNYILYCQYTIAPTLF